VASSIVKGRHALIIPSGGVSPDILKEISRGYGISEQLFLERLHIFYEKDAPFKEEQNVMKVDFEDIEKEVRRIVEFGIKLSEDTGNPPLIYIGIDKLAYLAGEKAIKPLIVAQNYTRAYNSLMFWLVKPIMPWIIERLAPIADIHRKTTREHGCTLLHGIKPRTPLYAIQLQPNKAPPIPDPIRIT